MLLISTLVVFTLITIVIRWYLNRRRIIKLLESLPGPPPLLIVGNALDLTSPTVLLPRFIEYKKKYGNIIKIWIGSTPRMVLTTDYSFIEYLLNSTEITNKSNEYKFLQNWLGNGLVTCDGDAKWKKHRKVIAPAFHFKVLGGFPEVFNAATAVLIRKLRTKVGKRSTDISTYITFCVLDIVCESVMGSSLNVQENPNTEYVYSVKAMGRVASERMFNPFLANSFTYLFSKQHFVERKAIKIIHNYVNGVIERKQKEFKDNFNMNSTIDDIEQKKNFTFLDLLLFENQRSESFTDENVREEVNTFMFAGHDTTSAAIDFCIFCLAEHQDVQKMVVEELREIFQDKSSGCAGYKELQQMKYLEAVIKETLRLYPPVPFIGRNLHKDLQYKGITLPKGLTMVIHTYGIHRDEEFFSNPEKFDPDRFLTENSTNRPYSYIPFSLGPRNCIGQKFAMLLVKSVLSSILRHFEILPTTPKHNLELAAESVLVSRTGICVRLNNRNF